MAKILIVEDEPDLRRLLHVVIERAGYTVVEAPSGERALEVLADESPDLVVLDVGLPKMDGWAVLEHIRSQGATPVVMLSAHGPAERERALAAGASDYLAKPFSRAVIVQTFDRLLGSA